MRLFGSTTSPAPSSSLATAVSVAARTSGDEWSELFWSSGSRMGTKGATSEASRVRAHRLEVQTVAFLTSS